MARRLVLLTLCAALTGGLVAFPPAQASVRTARAPRAITIGMGYVPTVQFAPFYVAAQRGYYRRAGLNVTFSYGASPNLLELVGAGRMGLAIADGTDTIAAAAQGVPVTYVMALYQRFPVAIFSLKSKGIRRVADLRGKTIGVPGRYGATYVGLLAALHAAGLSVSAVTIASIGYTQQESVASGKVDAAVGYSMNEPVLLAREGYRVNTLEVSRLANLVAPGVVAGRAFIAHDPGVVRAFVQATLHGLADTIANPAMAFAAARKVRGLTTLRGRDASNQYAVLRRVVQFWHDAATRSHGLGYADPAQWRDSARILQAIGQVSSPPAARILFTNTFSAGAARM